MYSFDVFDTLITRVTATPKGIFALLQHHLQETQKENQIFFSAYIKANFFSIRIGAEQVARNTYCKNGIEDVTLEQIYSVLVKEHLLTESQAEYLCKVERTLEVESVRGIPGNIGKVKMLLKQGERVVLISDMYLDAATIYAMLRKVDPIFSSIPLYVSSDKEKKGKWTGSLFRLVKEQEQVSYEEWHHCGDNQDSDYQVPKQLGILCELYKPERLLGVEEEYIKQYESEASIQLAIGCAKLARIYGKKNTAYQLGCSIGGTILYPYVQWLLEDAVTRKIKRLYFIARDGYLLKELADHLIKLNNLEISTYYLYGSRLAWRIPEGEDWKEEQIAIYWRSFEFMIKNPADLASFFQISEEELLLYLPEGLKQEEKIWTVPVVKTLLNHLLANTTFSCFLYKKYQEKKEKVIAYLKQEVDTTGETFAFVDLAGTGFTQECLVKIMRGYYKGKVQNYFYRRDMVMEGECKNYVFYPYYVPYYVLLEMMCRAPHGQTIGYQRNQDGKMEPILSTVDGEAIKEHGVPEFIQGAKNFTALYGETLKEYKGLTVMNHQIQFYLDYIYYRPSQKVLEYFAEMPNMLTGREQKIMKFAPKLTNREIYHLFWLCDKPMEYIYYGTDLEYSLLRCSEQQKKQIARYKKRYGTCYRKLEQALYHYFYKKEPKKERITLFDFLGSQIVIYGAGKKGQEFYQQVTGKVKGRRYHSKQVVLWIDQNVEQCQKEGLPVVGLEQVKSVEYDQLVIAIAKKETAEKVKQILLTYRVPEEKIYWIYDC